MRQITSLSVCGPTYGIGHASRQQSLLGTAKLEGWKISEQVINELNPVLPQLAAICDSTVNSTCLIIDLDPRFAEKYASELNEYLGNRRLQGVRKILIDGESSFKTKKILDKIQVDLAIFPYGTVGVNINGKELSGFGYSIFSKALQDVRKMKTYSVGERQNIVVSCGGSDPANISSFYLKALGNATNSKLHIKVVVGKFFSKPQIDNLVRLANNSPHKVEFLDAPSTLDDAFEFADLGFVTGGLTRNESMYSGVCTVVADINRDQLASTKLFSLREAIVSLGILSSKQTGAGETNPEQMISSILSNRSRQKLLIENAKMCFPENGASQVLVEIGDVCLV